MKRVALKDLDLAAYEVKAAHQLVSKWERVIEPVGSQKLA